MNKKITILSVIILLGIYLIGNVFALTITSVSTTPNEVQPGEKVSIDLSIKNDNDADARNVQIGLILNGEIMSIGGSLQQVFAAVPFAPYQSSSQVSFDRIDSDDYKSLIFNLITNPDADSGTYKIPVRMDYYINSVKQPTEEGVITVIVNAKPVITLSSDSAGLIKGRDNQVTIKMVNSGLGDAKFSEINVGTVKNSRIVGTDNFYIGDINKDDFDSVKLSLFVNSNAGSTTTIPVTINYKDSRNKDYTITQDIEIRTYTLKEAQSIGLATKSNLGFYITIIILVIIIYLAYRWNKKRKKNKLANVGN